MDRNYRNNINALNTLNNLNNLLFDLLSNTNNRMIETMSIFKEQNNIINNYHSTIEAINTRIIYLNHMEITNARINSSRPSVSITPPPTPPRNIRRRRRERFQRLQQRYPETHDTTEEEEHNNNQRNEEEEDEVLLPIESPRPIIPTNQEIVTNTEVIIYNSDSFTQSVCPIETIPFNEGQNVIRIINCGHIFTVSSLHRWFERDSRCPLCRYNISRRPTNIPNNLRPNIRRLVDNIIRTANDNPNIPSPTVTIMRDSSGNPIRRYDYNFP
jgi:hypothetical protein